MWLVLPLIPLMLLLLLWILLLLASASVRVSLRSAPLDRRGEMGWRVGIPAAWRGQASP